MVYTKEKIMQETTTEVQTSSATATAPKKPGKGIRVLFIGITSGLLLVSIGGLVWLFVGSSASPVGFGWYLFSFAAGLSMIVLPCTLPLAFVIVPLSMGKGYAKGFAIALSFGIGVAITLSMYGILAAVLGKAVIGFSGGTGEILKNWFYLAAGIFALVFALGELGFFKFRMPSYSGAVPKIIQKRKDLLKPLLLGLFLGNIGVGCPHPATPILLTRIAVEGNIFYGWLLFFVHAVGRIVPLFVLAMFGIIGINITKGLVRHREAIARATAWSMVFIGAFLLVFGIFGHDWWVYSGQHAIFEEIVQEERFTGILKQRLDSEVIHAHGVPTGTGMLGLPLWLGNWVFVAVMVIPIWWYWFRERKRIRALPEPDQLLARPLLRLKKWFFLVLMLLLGLIFIHVLPHRFLEHTAVDDHEEKVENHVD